MMIKVRNRYLFWGLSAVSVALIVTGGVYYYLRVYVPNPSGPLYRLPYVESLTTNSVNISWATDRQSTGAVEVVEVGAEGLQDKRTIESTVNGRLQMVHVDGLKPATQYHYRVLIEGQSVGDTYTFETAPDSMEAPVRFFVLGDSGKASFAQYRVARQIEKAVREGRARFGLHTGDVLYYKAKVDVTSFQNRAYFAPYGGFLTSVPLWVSLGNHDVRHGLQEQHLHAFALPGNKRWYSFDYGPLHVIVLDSNDCNNQIQLDWLKEDLEAHQTSPWLAAVFHHPPYSWPYEENESHTSDRHVREIFSPLLEQYGVDIVFNGHAHTYERTRLIREFNPDGPGLYYVVTGGGGAELGTTHKNNAEPDIIAFYKNNTYHFVLVDIEGDRLSLEAIADDGEVFDRFSFTQTDRPVSAP